MQHIVSRRQAHAWPRATLLLLQGTRRHPALWGCLIRIRSSCIHLCSTSTAPHLLDLLQVDVKVAQRIMNDVLGGDDAVTADADAEAEPGSPRAQP